MSILIQVLSVVCVVAFVYVLIAGYDGLVRLVMSLLSVAGYAESLHNTSHERQVDSDNTMPISIILPECDADRNVVDTVQGLLDLDFPEYEVIAICNSVRSRSLQKLVESFGMVVVRQPIKRSIAMQPVRAVYRSPLHPGLIVIDKKGVSRHDAVNAGINTSRYPLFVSLGAGCQLRRDALQQITAPFMKSHKVVAVGGLPRIGGKGGVVKGFLPSMQQAEYLRSFPAGLAVPGNKKLPLIPGAFSAFRKKPVLEEGGLKYGGTETELMLRLNRRMAEKNQPHETELFAEPVFQTEPPRGLGGLFRQRRVWQKDLTGALWRNRQMTFNPKYGRTGTLDIPYYWFFDVIGPILEAIGCIAVPVCYFLGYISPALFIAFLAAEVLLGMVISLAAVASQEIIEAQHFGFGQLLKLVLCALLNNVLYRQFIALFRAIALLLPRPSKQ